MEVSGLIIEFLFNILVGSLTTALDMVGSILTLPFDTITVLANIWGYGTFILGSDLFVLCMASFFFWFLCRLTVGMVTWLWSLLPFT